MASLTMYPEDERLAGRDRVAFNLYVITAVALFVLMMLVGLTMRMSQAKWLDVPPNLFYELLSMHGAGMVGTISLATTAVMWFFLRKYVRLHLWAFVANYVLFLLGALCIIVSIFVYGYGALWTFLYPLPVHGVGMWTADSSALFMLGYLLIGVGSLLFYLDAAYDRSTQGPVTTADVLRRPPPEDSDRASVDAYLAYVRRTRPDLARSWSGAVERDLRASLTVLPGGTVRPRPPAVTLRSSVTDRSAMRRTASARSNAWVGFPVWSRTTLRMGCVLHSRNIVRTKLLP